MGSSLMVNGFSVDATFHKQEIDELFVPLLQQATERYHRTNRRIVIFLAAVPGAGKSTLAAFLEQLSETTGCLPLQVLGMDGFHYNQQYLKTHTHNNVPLSAIKGAPETFDVRQLQKKLQQIKTEDTDWPVYDRNIHDVIPDKIHVSSPVVLIEGNYLLLDEPEWNTLHNMADITVFVKTEPDLVINRLIRRKMRGGLDEQQASEWVHRSDYKNVLRVLQNVCEHDYTWTQTEDYHFTKG
ncbi:MAG: nucleoside/nucleotide kinase family protein [Erysipelotrichaceae bacterium]|nr:nucleoside/nucleotide kinase family protein [Erysipelotrichaceae bacterium]